MSSEHGQHSNMRFYIVLITVVVGAIFFLLLMTKNYTGDGFSLTSAVIGEKKTLFDEELAVPEEDPSEEVIVESTKTSAKTPVAIGKANNAEAIEKVFNQGLAKSPKDIDLKLSLNEAPTLNQKIKLQEMVIQFSDLNTIIQVNGDDLDLSNLGEVILRISGFTGRINLNNLDFSLAGKAKSIQVNDMTLSSKGDINLSIDNLNYKVVNIDEIEVDNTLTFDDGQGKLELGDKLIYNVDQDLLKVYYFNGKLMVDKGSEVNTQLEGVTKGLTSRGALLNFNIR